MYSTPKRAKIKHVRNEELENARKCLKYFLTYFLLTYFLSYLLEVVSLKCKDRNCWNEIQFSLKCLE